MASFPLGQVVATPAALALLERLQENPATFLARHRQGDWGDVSDDDRKENDRALLAGTRLFSSYQIGDQAIWIITEADRSATTILLPSDY